MMAALLGDVSAGGGHAPRRLLINDEGNSALHHLDLLEPRNNWSHAGAGRDLQLVGGGVVLRSQPAGYVELELATGAVVREVVVPGAPGGIESARRLPDGATVVAGNAPGGAFLWELDPSGRPRVDRMRSFAGIEKVRLLRRDADGAFLFCSQSAGANIIHRASWEGGISTLFVVSPDVPADSMVKAVRVAPNVVVVSTGYAASLLRIDVSSGRVVQTIGGTAQPEIPGTARPLSPFFFSGFQTFADGHHLVCNWQGHSAAKNGQGYQLIRYDAAGQPVWIFDQAAYPALSSLNNVIALDGLDTSRLHDEPNGILRAQGA
ncbi:MAG: hypothetical protein ABUS79_22660 [Pseudomonadota bacterium]